MNKILAFIFSGFIIASNSQTPIIAHKSHSGTAVDFFIDPSSNFGDPGPQLLQVVRLNDSAYIEVYYAFSGIIYHDTIRKSQLQYYNKDIDSVYQQEYYKHVEYLNLKKGKDADRVKPPSLLLPKMIENPQPEPQKLDNNAPVPETTHKKKKRSYILFLFVITGGGMLLMQLFRIFKSQPSIT